MIQTLIRNWWLLAVCGVLDAIIAVIYFNHAGRGFHALKAIEILGTLTLAAGVCTIAAGIWRSAKGKCWLLALNGLALGALGLIFSWLTHYRISLRTVALLIILMATSIAILELVTAQRLWRQGHGAEGWFLGLAGTASVGFALAFFALGFRWVEIEPGSFIDLLWLGSYFGFSAICMLGIGLRLNSLRAAVQRSGPLDPAYT